MVYRFNAPDETVRQDYFDWLIGLVGERGCLLLLKTLHERAFVAMLDKDENRGMDGVELREEYYEKEPYFESEALDGPCSVLEMLIALARRMSFDVKEVDEDADTTAIWFWTMLDNLGIGSVTDEVFAENEFFVAETIDDFLSRGYGADGYGGLFPLKYPSADQRQVEIWYQKESYLRENGCLCER